MLLPSVLPGSLSIGAAGGSLYSTTGLRYDYAIGSLPFISGASKEHPIIRQTAPIRKNQFDTANTPGEQSLDGWWLRSQQSFHAGAGQLFVDPTGYSGFNIDATSLTRFRGSRGVNVWTAGRASLLNSVKKAAGSPIADVVDATEFTFGDGTQAALAVGGSSLRIVKASGATTAAFGGVSAKTLSSVTTDGSYMYVSTADGIFSAPIPASNATSFTWTKEYTVPGAPDKSTHLAYVKQRLMLSAGPAIYELPAHPAGAPAALPTAKHTAADSTWVWTGFTEASAAIYAVGNASGVRGTIIKFTLGSDGTIPTLTAGAVAAQLPSGEVPYSIMGYLGGFVAIGTNKGARISSADGSGNLTYGPLLFDTTAPVKAWTARNRFLWCTVSQGIDGDSGLYRIDLGTEITTDMRFAYATDLSYVGDTGNANAVAHLGSGDLIVLATANDLYIEDSTALATSGYLQTSRIRFGTLEPKLYKLVKVRGPALLGPLAFTVLDQGDHAAGSYSYPTGQAPDTDVAISSPTAPQDFISLKFTLTRDGSIATNGGEMNGYQLKALPAAPRRRIIQLPLLCFDFELDSKGNKVGYVGSALKRLQALEGLETTGNSVVVQDLVARTSVECVIETVEYQQMAAPPRSEGYGGLILLTLRTVV